MQIEKLKINEIPALLWNKPSDKLIVAVHGSHSSKIDDCIWILAEEADKQDYQVLSFDLPCHGERVYELEPGRVEPYLANLAEIMKFARKHAPNISLFACSMGAYFSLLAYAEEKLDKCLFLSPVVNMLQVIQFIMLQIGATPEQLQQEKTIPTQFETLSNRITARRTRLALQPLERGRFRPKLWLPIAGAARRRALVPHAGAAGFLSPMAAKRTG